MSVETDSKKIFFIADIGTTTIKASLCAQDCVAGKDEPQVIASLSEKNAQSVYGLDVISRVLYAHHNGVASLQKKVCAQLSGMLSALCALSDSKPEMLSGIILTGNTVMLHLVRGLSVQGFEMAPFSPATLDAAEMAAGSLFERSACPSDIPVWFPPCIDAFLGADTVCAALAAVERNAVRYPLLIADVGTNSEILLITSTDVSGEAGNACDYKITCCSTAAGPAFEGGVLGGRYTGSELIHQLAELLKAHALDETGFLDEKASICVSKPGMPVMTQEAVRQLQLAKGAVCAAIDTLLEEEGMSVGDVGSFVLCGNFGSALNAEEAERIGLFPAGLAAVAEYAGNAAELGASLLVSEEMRGIAKKIAASGKLIQLADSSYFVRRYIERMNFGN